ncbi:MULTISPECIES: hypothetical protein [Burkholderia cepacia complex]|uniref:hypothetical protein n=1 Tax=Burkholderia cepacia complex TaxID=87882 RepID=UPI0009B50543|nr:MULTISPECIES: hypothetical protein [Burkholderia cepacia complex]
MNRKSSPHHRVCRLSKAMLLPLPASHFRAVSLEYHLALATIVKGHANLDLLLCLLKTIYMAFYLRDKTQRHDDARSFKQAEAAIGRCILRAEDGEEYVILDREKSAIERILILHDEQLATVPKHRYLTAIERLHQFAKTNEKSPISASD